MHGCCQKHQELFIKNYSWFAPCRKDLKESGMDMDADIICEDEDPFADMAKDLKHNFNQRKMIMKMNSKN